MIEMDLLENTEHGVQTLHEPSHSQDPPVYTFRPKPRVPEQGRAGRSSNGTNGTNGTNGDSSTGKSVSLRSRLPEAMSRGSSQLAEKRAAFDNAGKDKNGSPKKHQLLDPRNERHLPAELRQVSGSFRWRVLSIHYILRRLPTKYHLLFFSPSVSCSRSFRPLRTHSAEHT